MFVLLVLVDKSGPNLPYRAAAHQAINGTEIAASFLALQDKFQSMEFVSALLELIY